MSSSVRALPSAELLRCVQELPSWLPAATFEGSSRSDRTFRDPTFFTRWLFRQQRGAGVPRTPLLVGWREAKPCAQAIIAARTGNTTGLRDDQGRPELRVARPGVMSVAVKDMIVAVEQSRTRKAQEWAQDCASGISIHLVSSIEELDQVWQAIYGAPLAPEQPPRCTPPSPTSTPPSPTLLGALGVGVRPPPGLEHLGGPLEISPAAKQPLAPRSPYPSALAPSDARASFGSSTFDRLPLEWTDLEWNREMTLMEPTRFPFPLRVVPAAEMRPALAFPKDNAWEMSFAYRLSL